jgi:hypothetical protein
MSDATTYTVPGRLGKHTEISTESLRNESIDTAWAEAVRRAKFALVEDVSRNLRAKTRRTYHLVLTVEEHE